MKSKIFKFLCKHIFATQMLYYTHDLIHHLLGDTGVYETDDVLENLIDTIFKKYYI